MKLLEEIHSSIRHRHLLSHPFYQDWMCGKLSMDQLRNYATQYTPFEESFPRFVSATHSQCKHPSARKVLLENLLDEEGYKNSPPHPELWQDFSHGIGANPSHVSSTGIKAKALEQTYFNLCRSSYEEGLCALYTYEYQIPEIAKAKIQGLAKHYGIQDERTLQFFSVHQKADVWHSQACAGLIDLIDEDKKNISLMAAQQASEALWDFLTEVHDQRM